MIMTVGVCMVVAVIVVVGMIMAAGVAMDMIVIMRVGMAVVMRVAMIMRVVVTTAATVAVIMIVVLGIDQRRGQPALERDGLLTRGIAAFDGERHHLGAETQIVHLAEIMPAQAPLAVEYEHSRRALNLVGRHGLRHTAAIGLVERDRERDLVLVDEGFERGRSLLVLMLERGVEADDHHLIRIEGSERREACGRPCLRLPAQCCWKAATTTTLPFRSLSFSGASS